MTQHKILNQSPAPDPWISGARDDWIQKIYGFLKSGVVPNRALETFH
uniref:Uncharacterized protein n=1 Tax=Arundo donax TaxID=35708 RepID=A0A0A9GTR4_ARUDO